MVTIVVHWNNGDEEYQFDDKDVARMFVADALTKCGNVTYSWKENEQVKR